MSLKQAIEGLQRAGYQHRAAQVGMMELVAESLQDRRIAVVEAGTGVGKTFGYLIPALLALGGNLRLVVATATVSLQEQLVRRDLPDLRRRLGFDFRYAVAKGRRRYVCPHRLFGEGGSGSGGVVQQLLLQALATQREEDRLAADALRGRMRERWQEGSWSGDGDDWPETCDARLWSRVWAEVSTDRHGCIGRTCQWFDRCPFFRARAALNGVQVVVANHALLLADIALGGGVLLPAPEVSIPIIDEAHHLPVRAVDSFAAQAGLLGATDWLAKVASVVADAPVAPHHWRHAGDQAAEASRALLELSEVLQANFDSHRDRSGHWRLRRVPDAIRVPGSRVAAAAERLLDTLEQVRAETMEETREDPKDWAQLLTALGFLIGRTENLHRCWRLMVGDDAPGQPPVARWFTLNDGRDGAGDVPAGQDYQAHASPISAAAALQGEYWQRCRNGAVLCSATLRAAGRFDRFLQDCGLWGMETDRVRTGWYPSPFPYRRSRLVIPRMRAEPEGADSEAHTREVIRLLAECIQPRGGTLVLFTAMTTMRRVHAALDEELRSHVLMQGERARHVILKAHRRAVAKGGWSVIFGLQSFAEGVDLPGDQCRHVIICKLPFAVPTTPIEQTRREWIEANGGNAFMELSVPQAARRLVQAAGRLVRREEDRGQVTILDRRVVTRRYGDLLLADMPDFTRIVE
jgi:ATP-dependent DNA helicase DinG